MCCCRTYCVIDNCLLSMVLSLGVFFVYRKWGSCTNRASSLQDHPSQPVWTAGEKWKAVLLMWVSQKHTSSSCSPPWEVNPVLQSKSNKLSLSHDSWEGGTPPRHEETATLSGETGVQIEVTAWRGDHEWGSSGRWISAHWPSGDHQGEWEWSVFSGSRQQPIPAPILDTTKKSGITKQQSVDEMASIVYQVVLVHQASVEQGLRNTLRKWLHCTTVTKNSKGLYSFHWISKWVFGRSWHAAAQCYTEICNRR